MDPWASALIQLGVGGIGLFLFTQGKLLSEAVVNKLVAAITAAFEARITEWRDRYIEMREDRDAWRELALGTEERLGPATAVVATAIGAPVPPVETGPSGRGGLAEGYTAADRALRRGRTRRG